MNPKITIILMMIFMMISSLSFIETYRYSEADDSNEIYDTKNFGNENNGDLTNILTTWLEKRGPRFRGKRGPRSRGKRGPRSRGNNSLRFRKPPFVFPTIHGRSTRDVY